LSISVCRLVQNRRIQCPCVRAATKNCDCVTRALGRRNPARRPPQIPAGRNGHRSPNPFRQALPPNRKFSALRDRVASRGPDCDFWSYQTRASCPIIVGQDNPLACTRATPRSYPIACFKAYFRFLLLFLRAHSRAPENTLQGRHRRLASISMNCAPSRIHSVSRQWPFSTIDAMHMQGLSSNSLKKCTRVC